MASGTFPWWYPRKSHEAWSRVRKKGMWRFVVVNGVLMYGGLMFLFIGLLSPYVRRSVHPFAPEPLATSAIVWAVAGLTWGVLMWHFSEKYFLKFETNSGVPTT